MIGSRNEVVGHTAFNEVEQQKKGQNKRISCHSDNEGDNSCAIEQNAIQTAAFYCFK